MHGGDVAEPFERVENRCACGTVAAAGDDVDVAAEPTCWSGCAAECVERVVEYAARGRGSGGDLVVDLDDASRRRADRREVDHDGVCARVLNGWVHRCD